jgi:site-specific DNA-methyltransferase (adenine-specific)
MARMEERSVDLILCDLPYGITANAWDSVIDLERMWEQFARVLKARGAAILTACQPFTSRLVTSNRKWFRHEWIWDKRGASGHLNAKRMPMRRHESVLVFARFAPNYFPLLTKVKDGRIRTAGRRSSNYGSFDRVTRQTHTGYPTSILQFPRDISRIHPTQKPVALFEYLIRTYSRPGALVLDCCMGSGTTAVACVNSGRDFIGFETNAEYRRVARIRVAKTIQPSRTPLR